MNFITRLKNRFSKPIEFNNMIVESNDDAVNPGLKKGSAKKVSFLLYEINKKIEISEDAAIILIEKKAGELWQ